MKRTTIAAALIGLATIAAGPADTYPIHLSLPCHVGDEDIVSTTVKRTFSQIWTDAGDPHQPVRDAFTATLDGTRTVNAVSSNGRATKLTIDIVRCQRDGADLLPAGTTIVAENLTGKMQFKVNGALPVARTEETLRVLIYAARPDEPSADDEFGTDQPRKVGDAWPLRTDAIAKSTRLPFPVTGADFEGQAKLTAASTVSGRTTETVNVTERCRFDSRVGRSGATFKNMDMQREFTFNCPWPLPGMSHARSTFKVHYLLNGPGKLGTQDLSNEVTSETTYTAIPAKLPTTR